MHQYIIARYNENLDWLQHLRDQAIIYNKGDPLPNTIPLPNIGREAHTYLYHICANYANLAEVIVFAQGYIGDHIPPGSTSPAMYLQSLAEEARIFGISNNFSKTQISPAFNIYNQEELRTIYKVENPTSQVFGNWFLANFNMSFPANCCNIYYGAIFAMRRDKILSRSKEFYQKLLRQLVYTNAPIEAHFLERSWWYIPHHTFSNTRFYGICLKDIKERLYKIKAIQDILPQLEVVNAIDAQRNFSEQDIQTLKNNNFFVQRKGEYVDSFGRAYQKGAVACFLSHKKVMEMVKVQKEEYAVVFEDDIRLLPDFHEKMYKVFEMLGDAEFDICNLYVHLQQRDPTIPHQEIFWVPPGFIGTQCLLFKKSSIHRVLAALQQYGDPIDEQLSRDLDLQYIYISNIDLLICDEIPSVIQDQHLKYLKI